MIQWRVSPPSTVHQRQIVKWIFPTEPVVNSLVKKRRRKKNKFHLVSCKSNHFKKKKNHYRDRYKSTHRVRYEDLAGGVNGGKQFTVLFVTHVFITVDRRKAKANEWKVTSSDNLYIYKRYNKLAVVNNV